MENLPAEYGELHRWFPTTIARGRALGVSREIIRRWELAPDATVRSATATTIRSLEALCRAAERRTGDPVGTGTWMLAPQPLLRGARVVDLIRSGRLADAAALIDTAVREPVRRSYRRDPSWSRPLPFSPTAVRDRPRDPAKAVILERLGEPAERIGPVER